jgi:hypothetical protein
MGPNFKIFVYPSTKFPKEVNTVFAQSDDWTCTNKNKSLYHVTEVNKIKVRKVKSDYSTYFPIEKSSPKNIS